MAIRVTPALQITQKSSLLLNIIVIDHLGRKILQLDNSIHLHNLTPVSHNIKIVVMTVRDPPKHKPPVMEDKLVSDPGAVVNGLVDLLLKT